MELDTASGFAKNFENMSKNNKLAIADDYSKLYFLGIMQICKNGLR